MKTDACYQLGHVIKPHGFKGTLKVFLDVDFPEKYKNLKSVFVEKNQKLIPFFIRDIQLKTTFALVSFEEVNSFEEAQELKSSALFLPLSQLPKLEKGKFYYHELIGYDVEDVNLGKLGVIKSINSTTAQDLLIMDYKEKEILIPYTLEIVTKIKNRTIYTLLPDGLIDLYL